jgi:hypothetical protein
VSGQSLYRFYDRAGDLLYVGITGDFGRRCAGHRRSKPWWPEVATCRIEHFPDLESAQFAEDQAVKAEEPRWNSVGVVGNQHHRAGVNAASVARSELARTRRFQRYLREMREDGLTIHVTDDRRPGGARALPEFNSDPAAFPEA